MPDLRDTSCRSISSLQRWHSFKNVGGCMTVFSPMFRFNRMLGGLSNYLPISGTRPQNSESHTKSRSVGKRSSAKGERIQEAQVVIDLRRILDAKQEPFVLQDIIWEKRHPVRSQSSRELKFDFEDVPFPSGKPQSSKRSSSKNRRRASEAVAFDDVAFSQENGMASSALAKASSIPAESIVALPSSQASSGVRKQRSSSSQKAAMAAKSPVKSPNKKALLMEAAARILEGSSRQTARRSAISARSLLRELDGSKQRQGCSTSKKALVSEEPCVDACANEGKKGKSSSPMKENGEEGKACIHSDADHRFSFVDQCEQDSPSSLNDGHLTEMPHKSLNVSTKMSMDLDSTLQEDQSSNEFAGNAPFREFLEPLEHAPSEIATEIREATWCGKTPFDEVECTCDGASSKHDATRTGKTNDTDAQVISDACQKEVTHFPVETGGKLNYCTQKSAGADRIITPTLMLCNYSWWSRENIDLPSAAFKKTFGEGNGGENDEEDSSTSPDHSDVDEFQQSSPVSVLDAAVYDGNPSLGKSFDYFDEARQKLLESVRRYEMLMQMDLDSLIAINKNFCHEFEEESVLPNHEGPWENNGHDICGDEDPLAMRGTSNDLPSRYGGSADKEGDGLGWHSEYGYEATEFDICTHSDEKLGCYDSRDTSESVMDAKESLIGERESRLCNVLLDCSSEPSNSGVFEELRCPLTLQANCSTEISGEVAKQIGAVCINAILQTDLKSNSWSNFNEDMKAMETELERYMFEALMQELLSDLLCQVSSKKGITWLQAHICSTSG